MTTDDTTNVDQATYAPVVRGLRVRRLILLGPAGPFTVDFAPQTDDLTRAGGDDVGTAEANTGDVDESLGGIDLPEVETTEAQPAPVWPLSVIAGRTNTGKTSILRFIEYVLGAKDFPRKQEVLRQVRSAVLEVDTPDGIFSVERTLESNRVLVYPGEFENRDALAAETFMVEPTSDPSSISQWVLTTVGLQDIDLKEAPTQQESGVDRLSFRDLIWTCLYLNERVGSLQLLHDGNTMKSLKLRQVVDAIFDVHDNEQADLARRIKDAATNLKSQSRALEQLTDFVEQQQPKTAEELNSEARELDLDLDRVADQLRDLEQRERAASDFASEMRAFRTAAAIRATQSAARVRDRLSQLDRFGSLRAQYADDVRKLTMLVEAESLFDQLSVTVCPACFSALTEPPRLDDGVCSLCHTDTRTTADAADEDAQHPSARAGSIDAAAKELRAAKRRYKELDEYWQRQSNELASLRATAEQDAAAEAEAAGRLDAATKEALSPFLAERTELTTRRQAILVQRSQVIQGLKLHTGLESRQIAFVRAERNLESLRKQYRDSKQRPDRDRVISDLSARYRHILEEIRYPKVHEQSVPPPFIDSSLVPYVRGQHFKEASSGGQVLVTLAWALAIFEVAYETGAAHPGILMIDTPQKNLGGKADDTEFADIHLVEALYDHIVDWLTGAGAGAQVIIVDNTPPSNAEEYVRVRYTRDPNTPPFGLIANETGYDGSDDDEPDVAGDELP
ncbi:ATP-binding protein [Aeromicrobium massiliense]|uniref:ATP-binding protein n=1 Tax=Aeromicrobium massiliense TaxID=1464554 RepID=UPI0002E2AAEF|nr:ATP-binding protein [Aeromicrobium massiliense]